MPTFASVNYISDDEDEDEDNDEPPPLLSRSECSSRDEDEDKDRATKTARSNNKVARAMKKLSGTSYNTMPVRILQAGRTGLRALAVDLAEMEMFRNLQI